MSVSQLRPIAQDYHRRVKQFIDDNLIPIEREVAAHGETDQKWTIPQIIEDMKVGMCTNQLVTADGNVY